MSGKSNDVLIRKLRAPVYKTSLWIVVSKYLQKSFDVVEDIVDHKIVNDVDRKSSAAYVYAYVQHNGKYRIMIFLHPKSKPGTIAHECHHVMNILLGWHGQRKSQSNDEHESYLLEWLVDQAHTTLKKYK